MTTLPECCPACGNTDVYFSTEDTIQFLCTAQWHSRTGSWWPECGIAFSQAILLRQKLELLKEQYVVLFSDYQKLNDLCGELRSKLATARTEIDVLNGMLAFATQQHEAQENILKSKSK